MISVETSVGCRIQTADPNKFHHFNGKSKLILELVADINIQQFFSRLARAAQINLTLPHPAIYKLQQSGIGLYVLPPGPS